MWKAAVLRAAFCAALSGFAPKTTWNTVSLAAPCAKRRKHRYKTPPVPAAAPAAAQPEPQLPGTIVAQLDALNRKLAAANLELRRYETRMFAYERTVYALKQENAELEALCRQARQGEALPPEPKPQEPVLDQPGLPVIRFTPDGKEAAETEEDAFYDEVSPPRWNPLQEPRTPLDHLSVQLLAQFDRMMGAGT